MKRSFMILTLIYCGAIFYSSSRNLIDTGLDLPFADKLAHFCVFGGLSLIVGEGIFREGKWRRGFAVYGAPILFAVLYGISDEVHQLFVEGRSASVIDLITDVAGAVTAQVVVRQARIVDAKKNGNG